MTVDVYTTASVHVLYSDVLTVSAMENGSVLLMQQTSQLQTSQIYLTKPHHLIVNY